LSPRRPISKLAEGVSAFTRTLATRIVQLKPYERKPKGPSMAWLEEANRRVVRTLKAAPVAKIARRRYSVEAFEGPEDPW
jgi:hypothetical protein